MPGEHRSAQIGRPSSKSLVDWTSSCGRLKVRPALHSMQRSQSLMQRGIGHTPGPSMLVRERMHGLSLSPGGKRPSSPSMAMLRTVI